MLGNDAVIVRYEKFGISITLQFKGILIIGW